MVNYSIVVPVYNSSQYLTDLVDSIEQVFVSEKESYEIILVNDASSDRSIQVLQTLAKQKSTPIRIIDLIRNCGQYTTTLIGIYKATGNVVITIDADFTPEPSCIKTLMHPDLASCDLLYGDFKVQRTLYRQWGSVLFNNIVKVMSDKKFDQSGSSFRLVKRNLLNIVLDAINHPILLDVYLLQSASAVRFVQLPVQQQGLSSHNFLKLAVIIPQLAKAVLSKVLFKERMFLPDVYIKSDFKNY